LQIAVDRGSGGRGSSEKADWLPGAIASWVIENGKHLLLLHVVIPYKFCLVL